jgi:hypothetical protein
MPGEHLGRPIRTVGPTVTLIIKGTLATHSSSQISLLENEKFDGILHTSISTFMSVDAPSFMEQNGKMFSFLLEM